jgi:site-specific recombinase XerD
MARRGKRVRASIGIYRDKTGFAVTAKVRGHRREERFPRNATISELRGARDRLITTLEAETPEAAVRGTLADLVDKYLKRLPEGSYANDRAQLLAPWARAHGDARFASLTRPQIVATLQAWQREGLSATTRNHRLSALRVLWRTVAPDGSLHPCERVKRAPAPKPERNRARSLSLITEVLKHVTPTTNKGKGADSQAKLQLELLAWTGQPSASLARVRPEHVRWDMSPPEVYLQPRRKGDGAHGRWIPLMPQAAAALRAWLALGVEGPWHRGSVRLAFQRAIKKAQEALLKEAAKLGDTPAARQLRHDAASLTGMRVYDLRHSFLTAMILQQKNVQAVSEYAQHSDIRTTMAYLQGASSELMREGIAAMASAFPVPPAGATLSPLNSRVGSSKAKSRRVKLSHVKH